MGLLPYADQHYDADPPSEEAIQHGYDFAYLVSLFRAAGEPPHVAFNLALAVSGLRRVNKRRFQLDEKERDELVEAVILAHAAAIENLPQIDPKIVDMGMRAAATLALWWAEDEERRKLRHPDTLSDLYDATGILVDALSIERRRENMADRKARRQRQVLHHTSYEATLG